MTKEKTARLIPNAIQLSTDSEKVRREGAARRPPPAPGGPTNQAVLLSTSSPRSGPGTGPT